MKFIMRFILLMVVGVPLTHAQNQYDYFRHISTSDGFALNTVNSIDQDEKGLIWFGTRNGLMRYDGANLKIMRREGGFLEQQGINDIYSINVDPSLGIWIGSRYGLSIYYHQLDSSKDFEGYESISVTSSSRRVFDFLRLNANEVWIGGGRGLEVYFHEKDTIVFNTVGSNGSQSINSNRIISLFRSDQNGSIWVGTDKGISQVVDHKGGVIAFENFQLNSDNHSSIGVNDIIEDHDGTLWVGTDEGLLFKLKNESEFKAFDRAKLTNHIIRCLTLDQNNRIWVGTYDGLNIISKEVDSVIRIKHDPGKPDGLTGNNIRSLFTDKDGGVWIGTYFGGVNYWSSSLLNFDKIDERSGTQLGYNVVSTIVEDESSKIYFGTEGSGINVYDPKNSKFSKISYLTPGNDIGSIKVKDLLYEGDSKFWIGTFDQGILHLDLKRSKLKKYRNLSFDSNSLSSDRVISLAKAHDGNLWIGTLNTGLDLFDPKSGQFRNFNANDEVPAIKYNNVRSVLVTRSGDLYVGTGAGLSYLSLDDYSRNEYHFKFFQFEDQNPDNLIIHDLIEDRNGRIWLATFGSGLYYLEDNKLISFPIPGISSVFAITEGEKGVIWLSTEEGVVYLNSTKNSHKIYNKKDGVYPNEFNRGAKLTASDGVIYFGGASGVTAFHPLSLGVTNNYAPQVVITRFDLFGEELKVGDTYDVLTKSIEYVNELTLDYDQNIFSIHYAMPNYINPEKNTYSYRLLGLDDSWVKTSNQFVSFTIQRGGSYIFEIKGFNSNGVETSEITRMTIRVKDAPWLTGWAYTIYFLVTMGTAVVLIYFFKSRLQLQHKLELETREFIQQQEVNQQKLQFFTNISHEFRTPLTLISGPLEKLIEEYKGPRSVFRQLLVIKKNTDQLFKLINELMDFRKLESKQMKLSAAEGNIVKFAKEIFLSFDQQAKINKINYSFESDSSEIRVHFDRDKLEKVLYNLISNAFKYTPSKGTVKIKLQKAEGSVRVAVSDNGEGIPTEYLDKIFERFYEVPKLKGPGKYKQGSGIGLALAKNLIDLHKGHISASSEVGKGSTFVMELLLGRDHLNDDEIIESFKDSEDVSQYVNQLDSAKEPIFDDEDGDDTSVDQGQEKSRILIVEDNVDIAGFMRGILSQSYRVILAENGAEGFQKALSEQPELIISDVMMPVMDGIEFCSKVKTDVRTSHIPFILLTARTSLVYKYDGLESGADEYLSKPFEIKELLLKCKNMIGTQKRLKKKFSDTGEFSANEPTVNSIDEVMMNNAVQLIKENIGNEFLSIQLLCDKLGISRSLLFIKFKAWTNQTPNDYILAVRMKRAATLLEQNKVNISEVGYMVGFRSANYFSKSFKKFFSMSPKAYYQKFKEGLGIEDDQ